MTRPPDPDTFLDFADSANSDTRPRNDLEATYLRVQRAFTAPSTTLAPSARASIHRTIASTPQPNPIHRLVPTWRHNLNTIQAAASFIGVLVLIGALFALAFRPQRPPEVSQSTEFPPLNEIYPDSVNATTAYHFRTEECVANGPITSDEDILTRADEYVETLNWSVRGPADPDVAMSILTTFANERLCGFQASPIGTPSAIANTMESNRQSYYTDRARRLWLVDDVPTEDRPAVKAPFCDVPTSELELTVPMLLNVPAVTIRTTPASDGSFSDYFLFHPAGVFEFSDNRYGVVFGSITTSDVTEPRANDGSVLLMTFIEQNGRYYIDYETSLFEPDHLVAETEKFCA